MFRATFEPNRSHSVISLQSPVARSAHSLRESAVADLLGESPNLLDDLVKDLEDWEAILSSLPDFGVDQDSELNEPPSPDPM